LKTLHLTNAWAETSGGIATFYRALIAEANRRGHEIRLIVPADEDNMQQVGDFGRIYRVRAPKSALNPDYRTIYPSQFLLQGSRIQEILAYEHPDLIEISDKYTLNYLGPLIRNGLLAAIDYRPVVVGLSQERMDDNVRAYFRTIPFAQVFASVYMRWLYFPFFDHHIANSEYTAEELRAAAHGHLIPRGTWIRCMGVELEHFSPRRRKPEHRRRLLQNFGLDDGSLLLYAGRLVPEKNLGLLFDTVVQLVKEKKDDYRLLVVGDGVEREFWERKCHAGIPGRVQFLGHVHSPDALADIYANADVFVHPNPREPFGIAPLEAMASGLPLVAPNAGGITSYANSENSWIVSPDANSFAAAVRLVITNPALRARKIEQALITAQQFRWERVAASFLGLYEELNLQRTQRAQSDVADFVSTPAGTIRASILRAAATTAIRGFRFWSKLALWRAAKARARYPLGIVLRSPDGDENSEIPA